MLKRIFPGDSEMARRMRAFDWSSTLCGPIDVWPQSLVNSIRLMLNSRYPMFVWWGQELTNFYNDAYIPVLGARHPQALGRAASRVWNDIWDVVGPQTEIVLHRGEATWNESVLLVMKRHGFTEETYFTFSYSPILGESGDVGGIFCACIEDTKRVLGERRLKTLRELAEGLGDARTPENACRIAAATLGANSEDLPFAALYLLSQNGASATLCATAGLVPGTSAAPQQVWIGNEATDVWNFAGVLTSQETQIIAELPQKHGHIMAGAWADDITREAVVMPLAKSGAHDLPAGFLVSGISPRLRLDDDYRGFLDLAASHVATAIASARAYEEERRRAEALAEIDRAKTVFFSNVSHEFRTPLTLILGPTEELLSGSLGDDADIQRAHLATVRNNALRLQKLVNTMLDFARVEAGRMEASYEPVDIGLLTRDLASTFCSAIHRAGLLFIMNCPSLEEPVYIDRDMWEKIVLNLLSNALKFTLKGTIEISIEDAREESVVGSEWSGAVRDATTTNGQAHNYPLTPRASRLTPHVVLTVRDTGGGIPREELPRLFDRFHRVPAGQARTQEGSGIGLALVHELVRQHGGSIEVDSEVGRGTTFAVKIPRGTAHLPEKGLSKVRGLSSTALGAAPFIEEALSWLPVSEPAEVLPAIRSADIGDVRLLAQTSSERILIADDNLEMRNYLKRLLETRWHVTEVADGATALELARTERPDLVVSDAMMPRLNGFELLRELREDESTRAIPVILLSARAGEEAYIEGMRAGADDYIVKPFGAREFIARVNALLEVTRVRRDSEKTLRESDERFRLATSAGKVGVWDWDIRANTVAWSDTLYEIHGVEPEDFGGTADDFAATIHPEDREFVMAAIERTQTDNSPYEIEFRVVRPSGEVRWIYTQAKLLRAAGEPVRMVGATVDITARKRAELSLAESLHQQKTLYDFLDRRYRVASLKELYDAALSAISSSLGCQRAAILLLDQSAVMRFEAWRGLSAEYRNAVEGHSPWHPQEPQPEPVCISDIRSVSLDERLRAVVLGEGIAALAFIPIVLNGRLIGKFMTYYNEPHVFAEKELDLSLTIARQLALGIDQKRAETALREKQERLDAELTAAERLQETSTRLIGKGDVEAIHDQILRAATTIMNADFASLQMLSNERGNGMELRLLARRGFTQQAAEFWEWVRADSRNTWGVALRDRRRVIVPDVEQCDFMAGGEDLQSYLQTGIRAVQTTPLLSREGELVGMISTHWKEPHQPSDRDLRLLDVLARQAADFIERTKIEEALRQRREQFETLLNEAPLGVYLVDADFLIREVNPTARAVFGNIPNIIGRDLDEVMHLLWPQAYADEAVGLFRHTLLTGEPYYTPERVEQRRDRGVIEYYEWQINRIPLSEGRYGVVCYFRDISAQVQAREKLKELDQRKDEFLANMSHEIRSPLTGIMGYADILMTRLKDPEDLEFLRTIKESGDYLIEIVNDILDLSKIEAGKLVFYIEPVPIHAVLADVQGLMAVRVREKKLALGLRYETALPETIRTDRTRLRQILINLLSNAVKFTETGRIDLVARVSHGMLHLEVVDTGIGIEPEHQKVLFQPFTQADTSSTRKYGGTGLGLTITKRLVEMLGGTISFESEPGQGSTFRVAIPMGAAVAEKSSKLRLAEKNTAVPTDGALRGRRVLVVDDREEICYLVSRYVQAAGGRIAEATNGESALQAVAAAAGVDPFDAIILDIQMPGMDGYEVVRALRSQGFAVPIIALTAGAMVGDREKCLKAGFNDYLTKPIDRHKLVDLIAQLARGINSGNARADGKRVLVVDDSHNACKFLTLFLEKRGYEVRSAHDGESAIAAARDFRPNVVLIDIRLPDIDGLQLMQRLKQLDSINGARFIGVSGYRNLSEPGFREFDYFLEKPVDTAHLHNLLREFAS